MLFSWSRWHSSKTTRNITSSCLSDYIYRSRISCLYVFVCYHRRCGILQIYFTRVRWEFGRWLAIFPGQSACYLCFPKISRNSQVAGKFMGRQSEIVTESAARRLTVSRRLASDQCRCCFAYDCVKSSREFFQWSKNEINSRFDWESVTT